MLELQKSKIAAVCYLPFCHIVGIRLSVKI